MATVTAKAPASKNAPAADWRVIFLNDIGAPISKTNLAFLDLWARFEGGMSHNNPLNTSLKTSHSTGTWNSSGVQNYDTLANGAHAAAQTLLNTPVKGYGAILLGFRGNAGLPTLAARVELSPWDANHYHGFNSKGQYVGGSLFAAAAPGIHKPGVGDFVGQVAHYTRHPGAGAETTASAAKKAAEGPVLDTLHYILYGLAIAGGGALVITGVLLIAADIGLSKRGPKDYGGSALRNLRSSGGESSSTGDEYDEAGREHAEFLRSESRRQGRTPVTEGDVDKPIKKVKPKVDVSRRLRKVA